MLADLIRGFDFRSHGRQITADPQLRERLIVNFRLQPSGLVFPQEPLFHIPTSADLPKTPCTCASSHTPECRAPLYEPPARSAVSLSPMEVDRSPSPRDYEKSREKTPPLFRDEMKMEDPAPPLAVEDDMEELYPLNHKVSPAAIGVEEEDAEILRQQRRGFEDQLSLSQHPGIPELKVVKKGDDPCACQMPRKWNHGLSSRSPSCSRGCDSEWGFPSSRDERARRWEDMLDYGGPGCFNPLGAIPSGQRGMGMSQNQYMGSGWGLGDPGGQSHFLNQPGYITLPSSQQSVTRATALRSPFTVTPSSRVQNYGMGISPQMMSPVLPQPSMGMAPRMVGGVPQSSMGMTSFLPPSMVGMAPQMGVVGGVPQSSMAPQMGVVGGVPQSSMGMQNFAPFPPQQPIRRQGRDPLRSIRGRRARLRGNRVRLQGNNPPRRMGTTRRLGLTTKGPDELLLPSRFEGERKRVRDDPPPSFEEGYPILDWRTTFSEDGRNFYIYIRFEKSGDILLTRRVCLHSEWILSLSERVRLALMQVDDEEKTQLLESAYLRPSDDPFQAYLVWLMSYLTAVGATQWKYDDLPWLDFISSELLAIEGNTMDYALTYPYLLYANLELEKIYQDVPYVYSLWFSQALGGGWHELMWQHDRSLDAYNKTYQQVLQVLKM